MNGKSPTLQEWKDLYDAAIEFQRNECWNWMWDSELFGVQNPETGEIGYCCIMGRLGEHFALAVYDGTEGLDGYLKIQKGEISSETEAFHIQKCLMASFEDRKFLQDQDLQVIKSLSLKFRGRNAWPFFRSHLPGYHPWILTGAEAKFLTVAIHQAIHVALRLKNNPEMLIPPADNLCFVRVPHKKEESLMWRDDWLEPEPLEIPEIVLEPAGEERLKRIKSRIPQQGWLWEIEYFYLPGGIQEKKERPCYPCVYLWVDHESGYILNNHVTTANKTRLEFVEEFVKYFEKIESLPREIWVKKEATYRLLKSFTSILGIELRKVKRLKSLEEAQRDAFKHFSRGR